MNSSPNWNKYTPYLALLCIAAISLILKISVIGVGAPYVTIDDQTMYEGGFLVWFGNAPPQRMYLESWISGASSIATYIFSAWQSGASIGLNVVADAYRDFYQNPDPYVTSYRSLALVFDLLTAVFVFLLARTVFSEEKHRDWLTAGSAAFFLLSYNTLWCYVVARPDTLTALFAAAGLYFYYKSSFGERKGFFYTSAIAFGLATGMKLHAAFFVVFICLDLLRVLGLKEGVKSVIPFGLTSVFLFLVGAGMPLFDPLLYIKLRLLNVRDDASPWLEWGDQFFAIFRGTGWLIVPLVLGAAFAAWKSTSWRSRKPIVSIILLALLWLALFASIRQLRAYWMLPALPLFYIAAVYAVSRIPKVWIQSPLAALILVVLGTQLYQEQSSFSSSPFKELRSWVESEIKPNESIYIFGYEALNLPKTTMALNKERALLEEGLSSAVEEGESYTSRHIRLWEERSRLELMNMLNYETETGYSYFSYHRFPLVEVPKRLGWNNVRYILVNGHFDLSSADVVKELDVTQLLKAEFEQVAVLTGPGGGGSGLQYTAYRRK